MRNTTVDKREEVLVKGLNEEREERKRVYFQCGETLKGKGYVEEEARTSEHRHIYDEGEMVRLPRISRVVSVVRLVKHPLPPTMVVNRGSFWRERETMDGKLSFIS